MPALVHSLGAFWRYYLAYTKTAIHAAATAALAIFGLLVFVDPLFAWVAIASYLTPPFICYLLGYDLSRSGGVPPPTLEGTPTEAPLEDDSGSDSDTDTDSDDGDTDTDS